MTEGSDELLVELDDGVLKLTINRPDARNALTYDLRQELVAQFQRADADLAVRCVVLTAAGDKAFCTGADLRSRPPSHPKPEGAPERATGDVSRMIATGWQRVIASIMDCSKPVVGGVNGTAAGGGLHLALACDLVIAADNARFISVFVRRGIAPDAGGAYILPRLVGLQKAKEICFFGDDIAAADAERMGLINRVVPSADLDKTVMEWARRLASGPTVAIGTAKRLLNASFDSSREQAFSDEAWGQEIVNSSADSTEGMKSFVERRDAEFKGW
ncbi:MAG: 2-(1,2-epoxy,2-dihydrophenyl)acetyl-CoA isomerase [Frankiales bacterium]|nr:2-(1,2-epoxy,2-dihydrophenyl)acetyl-CoA isomerase [Frankiales bacterium]